MVNETRKQTSGLYPACSNDRQQPVTPHQLTVDLNVKTYTDCTFHDLHGLQCTCLPC
jgi:hypothetical protein